MEKQATYEAAFAQADISPDFVTTLVGCYRGDDRAQSVLHPLLAQTLLFRAQGEIFGLLTVDNLGLTVERNSVLRAELAAQLGVEPSHVMINYSHTHSAPAPIPGAVNGERYFDLLRERVLACAQEARESFAPCKISWALGETELGENRRAGCTLADKRLGGLLISGAETGVPIALLLRVAAHANVLMEQNCMISSDYFGVAREALAEHFGCPVMLLQGAAGNLKPRGVPAIGGGDLDDLRRVAGLLVDAAQQLRFAPENITDLRMLSRALTLTADVPSREEAEKNAQGANVPEWLAACEELRQNGVKTQSLPVEMQFFKINEGCLCGVADEIFCELALDASRRADNPLFFLNGYTNGCTGYLPTREERRKGGFEVVDSYFYYFRYHGHVQSFREESAGQLVELAVRTWEEMNI